MSKALLKKSLAFVRSGRSENGEVERERRESDIQTKVDDKKNSTEGPQRKGNRGSGNNAETGQEMTVHITKRRRRMKSKTMKMVAEFGTQTDRRVILTPSQLVGEKRKLRIQRRKKILLLGKRREQNKNFKFSIFSNPHFSHTQ